MERMGLFDRLKAGLARTAQQFTARFEALVERADAPEQRTRAVDVETLDALEELLIMADVGVAATDEIVEAVRSRARRGESLRDLVKAGDPPHLRRGRASRRQRHQAARRC